VRLRIEVERDLRAIAVGERDHAMPALLEGGFAEIAQRLRPAGRGEQQRRRLAAQRALAGGDGARAHRRHDVGQHGNGEAVVAAQHVARRGADPTGGRGDHLGDAPAPREITHGLHRHGARGVRRPGAKALPLVMGRPAPGALDVLDRSQRIEPTVRRDRSVERLPRRRERSLADIRGLGHRGVGRGGQQRGHEGNQQST